MSGYRTFSSSLDGPSAEDLAPAPPNDPSREALARARALNGASSRREPGMPTYEAARHLLAEHFPHGSMARDLLAAWRDGVITLHADVRWADDDGIFDYPDGNCLRGNDAETTRPVISLRIGTPFREPDGNRYESAPERWRRAAQEARSRL